MEQMNSFNILKKFIFISGFFRVSAGPKDSFGESQDPEATEVIFSRWSGAEALAYWIGLINLVIPSTAIWRPTQKIKKAIMLFIIFSRCEPK